MLALAFLSLLSGIAVADGSGVTSPESRVHLIELFSSEGCSSCPPADAWLSSLRKQPGLFKTFVPIEFHVDYWNRLGWVDRFSRLAFTARQQEYASEWMSQGVYTPGFVLDGREWRPPPPGFEAPSGLGDDRVGVLSARRISGHRFALSFRPRGARGGPWRIYGALLGNGLVSRVSSGENSGRTLRHDFVVLALKSELLERSGGEYTAVVELGPSPTSASESLGFAFWVSTGRSQAPVQAVGGVLP
jgi:hypothetical protein